MSASVSAKEAAADGNTISAPGLSAPATVYRDAEGIARIEAGSAEDLYFVTGWIHAQDRLFQMDLTRRQPSGTLAELFGKSSLPGDVEARTIGLRRAAERSWDAISEEGREALTAYAAGVNAWVAANTLPPEYGLLGISTFEPWTEIDSLVIGAAIAFSLSFDLDTGLTEDFGAYLATLGADGAALFQLDVFRSAPFDCASTVPDATGAYPFEPLPSAFPPPVAAYEAGRCPLPDVQPGKGSGKQPTAGKSAGAGMPAGKPDMALLKELAGKAAASLRRSDFIRYRLDADGTIGSNEWGVTRALGSNARPVIANDPHLALNTPSTFYPMGQIAPGLDVFGSGFAGVPFVVLGMNKHIQWGATTNPMDVTDTYFELLQVDATGRPLCTRFQDTCEPVELIPEEFFFNNFAGGLSQATPADGVPPFTIIVPRRNNGPIIATVGGADASGLVPALSVQYTGFSPSRILDTFRLWNEARNLKEFKEGLRFFDVGSQNWVYADKAGNTAYFTSAEMPIRSDLQQGFVAPAQAGPLAGIPTPPWFIRDGVSGVHEWLPVQDPQPGQAVPYEILAEDEMPQAVNPPAGYFVNANNDPAGTVLDNDPLNQLRRGGAGIYYLNPGYADGLRAGTITLRLREKIADAGEVSFDDMQAIQADVSLYDARYFVPLIVQAFAGGGSSGVPELDALRADPRIGEAVGRLAEWDFTTPTGIQGGYDAGDPAVLPGALPEPDETEIANSVAATLFSVWRGQAIRQIIDASLGGLPTPGSGQAISALRHVFDTFALTGGRGLSGVVDFFAVPGVADPSARRDIKVLAALSSALDRLSGAPFEPAFANSTDQDDYRWGKLHRITFDHPFVPAFSIPPALGAFPPSVPGLDGIATDGGFGVVDASSHSARADDWSDFRFGSGPVRRYVGEPASAYNSRAESVWAGGTSGVPGSPYYFNLLPYWLSNQALPVVLKASEVRSGASEILRFLP
ncbi:MAG: penicillin acylase family protein [Gammaproteobacteria bacterium]